MIVYLRVTPGFGLAVEALGRPEILSCPAIMGGLPHERALVREVTGPAYRCGARADMTLAQARRYCPDAQFFSPDPTRYHALWKVLCSLLGSYTPLVEPLEMGQAICDLTGCERRWKDAREVARAIQLQVREAMGLTPCIGIASNRLVAELASLQVDEDGIAVVGAGEEREFLQPLPIVLLPGVDARLVLTFQILGLRTIGQFASLPASAVRQRFGTAGETLHRYARGIDTRSVVPPPVKPSVSAHYECEEGTIEEAVGALHRLADSCASELQQRCLAGKLIELTLEWQSLSSVRSRKIEETAAGHQAPSLPKAAPSSLEEGEGTSHFPIAYRIHSMLPQPGREPVDEAIFPSHSGASLPALRPHAELAPSQSEGERVRKASVALRLPVDTATPLLEHGQRLLLRSWLRPAEGEQERSLASLHLEVSEFEAPAQLSFAELNQLCQTGLLGGLGSIRLHALLEQEEVLTARHGRDPFRHLAGIDPQNILTERRFHWGTGLPWSADERKTGVTKKRRLRRPSGERAGVSAKPSRKTS